jgi:hypothetical protein
MREEQELDDFLQEILGVALTEANGGTFRQPSVESAERMHRILNAFIMSCKAMIEDKDYRSDLSPMQMASYLHAETIGCDLHVFYLEADRLMLLEKMARFDKGTLQ